MYLIWLLVLHFKFSYTTNLVAFRCSIPVQYFYLPISIFEFWIFCGLEEASSHVLIIDWRRFSGTFETPRLKSCENDFYYYYFKPDDF